MIHQTINTQFILFIKYNCINFTHTFNNQLIKKSQHFTFNTQSGQNDNFMNFIAFIFFTSEINRSCLYIFTSC